MRKCHIFLLTQHRKITLQGTMMTYGRFKQKLPRKPGHRFRGDFNKHFKVYAANPRALIH